MKKIFLLIITFSISLVACGSSPEAIVLQTVTAATAQAASWTRTPTSTATLIPTNVPTPTITPTPLPLVFIYQDDVPNSGRRLQEQAADKAYIYYSQYADLGKITIYTIADIEKYIDQIFPAIQSDVPNMSKSWFIKDWNMNGGSNTEAKDLVVISSAHFVWNDESNVCFKAKNVAHEMFHILQSRLMHHGLFRPALDYGPEWLKEGSSELMGNRLADGLNGCSYQATIDQWKKDSIYSARLKDIEEGDFSSKAKFWSIAPTAVDHLIGLAPDGEKSLINYYSEIGSGKHWHEAFKSAFGIAVEEFYKDFDLYIGRATWKAIDISVCIDKEVSIAGMKITCLGRLPYSTIPNQIDRIIYTFKVTGSELPPDLSPYMKMPEGIIGGQLDTGYLYISVDSLVPNGLYKFSLELPDGRSTTVTFQHISNDISASPSATSTLADGMLAINGKVILADGSQKYRDYIVVFCNLLIEQCLPGIRIHVDGSFFTSLALGNYKISVNPISGGNALGWYSVKGLVPDGPCADVVKVLKDQENAITIDLHISTSCN